MIKQLILSKIKEYFKLKKIKHRKMTSTMEQFEFCLLTHDKTHTCNTLPLSYDARCMQCSKKFSLLDLVRDLENMPKATDDEILDFLQKALKIDEVKSKKEETDVNVLLDVYVENKFDLVPVAFKCPYCKKGVDKEGKTCDKCEGTENYGKNPIEPDWTNKNHKEKEEWEHWLSSGLNIGVKTGNISNITVIDVDTKDIPEEVSKWLSIENPVTLTQITKNGYHFFFKYDSDFPKTKIDIGNSHIDIENDGGQVVIYPSSTCLYKRYFLPPRPIVEMPKELKEFLKSKITVPRKTESELRKEDIKEENFNLGLIKQGSRSNDLTRLGGIFRKVLNINQTNQVLHILNKHACETPLDSREIQAMVNSLDRYIVFDQQELAHEILAHVLDVDKSTKSDLELSIAGNWTKGEAKKRFNKALQYLMKEDKIIQKGKNIELVKDLEWSRDLFDIGIPINFKVPYLNDYAYFNWQDVIVIASKTGYGKTHLAMNMVKRLIAQGIDPHYIYSETGGRFAKNALTLGITPNQFSHAPCHDPRKFRLPKSMKRPVIIYDWFRPHDWAKTDEIFEKLLEKIKRVDGFLILFMQLKTDDGYFAPNLLEQFPSLVCKYLYEKEENGLYTKFHVTKIREGKTEKKIFDIPCRYSWKSKEVTMIEELSEEERAKILKQREKGDEK